MNSLKITVYGSSMQDSGKRTPGFEAMVTNGKSLQYYKSFLAGEDISYEKQNLFNNKGHSVPFVSDVLDGVVSDYGVNSIEVLSAEDNASYADVCRFRDDFILSDRKLAEKFKHPEAKALATFFPNGSDDGLDLLVSDEAGSHLYHLSFLDAPLPVSDAVDAIGRQVPLAKLNEKPQSGIAVCHLGISSAEFAQQCEANGALRSFLKPVPCLSEDMLSGLEQEKGLAQ